MKNCERIEIDVTTNRMERYCIAVQTTVLKLRPEAGDSSGQYRCYVERDNIAFTEFAPVYTVKLRLSSQTSSATSQTPLPLSCFRSDPATTPAAADETSTDAKAAVANSTVSSNCKCSVIYYVLGVQTHKRFKRTLIYQDKNTICKFSW